MSDFYHIFILPKASITRQQVESKLDLAVDWFRYYDRCYIIQTTSDENKWYSRLAPLVEPDGSLLICKLDPTRYHGFITKEFWKWFEAKVQK